MNDTINFAPHDWDGTTPSSSQKTVSEDTAQVADINKEITKDPLAFLDERSAINEAQVVLPSAIDELIERAEKSASGDIEPDESLIAESEMDSESFSNIEEIEQAAYARGLMDGEQKQKDAQAEGFKNAELRVIGIVDEIQEKKINLSTELESAILSFLRSVAHSIFDDLIEESSYKLIESKAIAFIQEHALQDYRVTLEVSDIDYEMLKAMDACLLSKSGIEVKESGFLKAGKATITAEPRGGSSSASLKGELDVKNLVDESIEGLRGE